MFSGIAQKRLWRGLTFPSCVTHARIIILRQYVNKISPEPIIVKPIHSKARDSSTLRNDAPIAVSLEIPALSATITKEVTSKKKSVVQPEKPWTITPCTDLSKLPQYYLKLSKIRLTSLVVITSMAGYAMAPAPFELSAFIMCSVGTGLVSSAANSINQFFEVPFDSQMSRTKNRVLVKGLLSSAHAVGFAAVASTAGLAMLYFGVNGLTAGLGAANLILYTCIYTPLKRMSIINTWVGSVVGAIPPLMGWAGCAGTLGPGAWVLGGLLYAWQFTHFNALSWNLRPDYSRAGYRMMAVTNPALCRRVALRYTGVLLALSCLAPALDVTNVWFALETIPLNGYFMYLAWKFYKESDSKSSRKLFRFSLVHLPALMLLFLLNKKQWFFSKKKDESINSELVLDNISDAASKAQHGPMILLQPRVVEKL